MDFTDYTEKAETQITNSQQPEEVSEFFRGLEEKCREFLESRGIDLEIVKYRFKTRRVPEGSDIFTLVSEKSGRGRFGGHRIMARLSYSPIRRSWAVGYVFNQEYDSYDLDSTMAVFWAQLERDIQLYLK